MSLKIGKQSHTFFGVAQFVMRILYQLFQLSNLVYTLLHLATEHSKVSTSYQSCRNCPHLAVFLLSQFSNLGDTCKLCHLISNRNLLLTN